MRLSPSTFVLTLVVAAGCTQPAPSAVAPVTPAAAVTGEAAKTPEPKPAAAETPSLIAAAVAASSRPADDRARDADRKPGEVLEFYAIKPGMVVADMIAGTGYYSEILAHAVGKDGKVFAHNTKWVIDRFADGPLTKRLAKPELANVVRWDRELEDLQFEPASLDAALMVLFYHDTLWFGTDRAAMNKQIFTAIKPGGLFGVIDHVAAADAGDVSKTLHRVDPQLIIREVTAAGFVLEKRSDLLRHPSDDHSINVFDKAIRGKTDRVVFLFRKTR